MPHRAACTVLGIGLLVLLAGPAFAEPPDLKARLEDYRALAPSGAGLAVREMETSIGALTLVMESGTVVPLRTPAGETLGFVFTGEGRYVYRSEHPADRAVIAVNLDREAPLLQVLRNEVHDRLQAFLVLFARPALEAVWKEAPAEGTSPAVSKATFDRIWSRVAHAELPFDHWIAEARGGPPSLQEAYVEIEGSRETVGFRHDRLRGFEDSLVAFGKHWSVDLRLEKLLSRQPASAVGLAVQLRHVELDVEARGKRQGRVDSELTLEAARDGLKVVPLYLLNNRDPERWSWNSEVNALRVVRVTDADGTELSFSHRYGELLVEVPRPMSLGQKVQLRVETEGEFFTGMGGQTHDRYFELFGLDWFPQPARWGAAPYTWEMTIRTPKAFYPVATGTRRSIVETPNGWELQVGSEVPSVWLAVFGGAYVTREETIGALKVRVHAYAMARKNVMESLPRLAAAMVTFYQGLLGTYPFQELDIVEVPEYGFGIAPAGMVLITTEAFKPRQDKIAQLLSRGINNRLAHEIAHQWFGHKAGVAHASDNWLSESLSEYLAGLAMGAANPDERKVSGFSTMLAEWRGTARTCAAAGSLDSANSLGGETGYGDRVCLLYNRGPLILHMFRTMVGEERFLGVLKAFLEDAEMQPRSTADFVDVVRKTVPFDLAWFFDQWVHEPGIPGVRVEPSILQDGSQWVLSGKATQPEAGFKKLVIPLVLTYPDGGKDVRLVIQEKPIQEFRFPVKGKAKVEVDPARNNLCDYK